MIIIKTFIIKIEKRRLKGVKFPSKRSDVPRNINRKKLNNT